MANITEDLQKILSSRYGKDVRQAIHDSISDINDVAESYEGQASASAESARLSAQSASTSAFNASESERYCRGVETQFSNAFIYCGTLTFAELMNLNIMMQKTGNCFNISDDFTSTEEFEDGGGKSYKAGTNVACTSGHKWDCLASDGGGGTSVGIELTQAEYDALPSSKLTDGVDYYITDATQSPFNVVEVTQAEYDSLTNTQKAVGQYLITDVDGVGDASEVGYGSGSVKDALDFLAKQTKLATVTPSDSSYVGGDIDLSGYRMAMVRVMDSSIQITYATYLFPVNALSARTTSALTNADLHRITVFDSATVFINYGLRISKYGYRVDNLGSSTWTPSTFRVLIYGIK